MILDWLKRKMTEAYLATSQSDMELYVKDLRIMSDAQVGGLLAVATVLRVQIEENRIVSPGVFGRGKSLDEQALKAHVWRLNKAVVDFRSGGRGIDCAAMELWVHTLKALHHPELHDLGRDLWREMARGLNEMDAAWEAVQERAEIKIEDRVKTEHTFVPKGLEPDPRTEPQMEET